MQISFVRLFLMKVSSFWTTFGGIFIGLVIGFMLANSYNRQNLGQNNVPSQVSEVSNEKSQELDVSDEEIKQKLTEAEQNPNNLQFQKDLGIALFRFSNLKNSKVWLPDIIRLLNRVYEKDQKDYEVIVTLGDAYLSLGKANKNADEVKKSREFYQKSLKLKPNDIEVITNLGLSYLPEEKEKAMIEFEKSLKIDSKHERTLFILEELKKQ
jgi:tetratricopeptide (TPR) repeat protein